MNCCEKCFVDIEIKDIIKGKKQKGNCDFCGSKSVFVYDIEKNDELSNAFEGLIDVYSSVENIPEGYPKDKLNLLKNVLAAQWNIFNLSPDEIYKFLVALLPEKYDAQPEIFDKPIGILELFQRDYLREYSILGDKQWEDFVSEIKNKNRFHTNIINTEILGKVLLATVKKYKKGQYFYRARICNSNTGYPKKEMGAPPAGLATSGRANPAGVSCLYLADTEETTLHEIRAGVYDYVSVGKFKLLQDIEVVNLADIDKISPFKDLDINLIAINLPHLKKIGYDIAKPLRRYDSDLDYIPTQYICDYVKSMGLAGIEYKSTMHENGINCAIFDSGLFSCISTRVYDIQSLSYQYNKV